jgi:hypothetical protein
MLSRVDSSPPTNAVIAEVVEGADSVERQTDRR